MVETAEKLLRRALFGPAGCAGLLLGGDFLTWAFDALHSHLSERSRGDGNSGFQTEARGPPRVCANSVTVIRCSVPVG